MVVMMWSVWNWTGESEKGKERRENKGWIRSLDSVRESPFTQAVFYSSSSPSPSESLLER